MEKGEEYLMVGNYKNRSEFTVDSGEKGEPTPSMKQQIVLTVLFCPQCNF